MFYTSRAETNVQNKVNFGGKGTEFKYKQAIGPHLQNSLHILK